MTATSIPIVNAADSPELRPERFAHTPVICLTPTTTADGNTTTTVGLFWHYYPLATTQLISDETGHNLAVAAEITRLRADAEIYRIMYLIHDATDSIDRLTEQSLARTDLHAQTLAACLQTWTAQLSKLRPHSGNALIVNSEIRTAISDAERAIALTQKES